MARTSPSTAAAERIAADSTRVGRRLLQRQRHALDVVAFWGASAVRYRAMTDKFVTLPEIRKHAKQILPRDVWNFGDGAAETETTLRRNHRSINRLAIRQNVLVDIREIDLSTRLLDLPLSWPVAVAPMGGLIMFHPQGNLEMDRGS